MQVYLFFERPTVYVNVMQVFWTKRGFISIRDAPSSSTNIFRGFMESTPEQWAESGHKLFNYGRFEQAIHCFERANLRREVGIAKAFQLREEAKSNLQPSEREKAFRAAGDAFIKCIKEANGIERTSYYRDAAKCFASAGDVRQAASFYITSEDFASAARQYQKGEHFDDLVRLLECDQEKISKWYRDELFESCVRHYYGKKILRFFPLFPCLHSAVLH